ncbi:His-Xaa-Ser system radical SAM maturase HxsB [Mesorhizobium sp.]|uniref:His-Xaa-Ser system radical SAM maturase HxsB n=1 Tax=Mesorhizobium sp. TaxID=1871066 RepID=UPI000FE2B4B5|nr:His-Xaa-Ser system radical SAM maturase HxsB [Mesorhizobium sp.]RWQ22731.1 MAG: His-Xaa-Ser system radical SAM maturase HxsB [Mesorhizobium sp.]
MTIWPLKFRPNKAGGLNFADDAGGFFRSDDRFLERYAGDNLSEADSAFLHRHGHAFDEIDDLSYTGFAYRWAARQSYPRPTSYVILVPTLRCNLACNYCQVSRADERALGYDWTEETVQAVLRFLGGLNCSDIKVEFQGGEPLLRVDLLERVRSFARERFSKAEFVVCTNLQNLGPAEWAFLEAEDTFISTSIDGDRVTHQRQRTKTTEKTEQFFGNLQAAVDRFGSHRISALPTIDPDRPPDLDAIVETFTEYGIHSIYLRPVNHQGFARKRFASNSSTDRWNAIYGAFIDLLIERNATGNTPVEEYYFVHCLRRVLKAGLDKHVDLRNPNFLGRDYLVVDFDGRFYPTDEARMLTRIGQIDLSIGNVFDGLERDKLSLLNENATNAFDPDCIHCPYQAFCGVDLIDDISRSARVDRPKHETDFCRRHMFIFDKVFDLIYSDEPKARKSLALWTGVSEFPSELRPVHQ